MRGTANALGDNEHLWLVVRPVLDSRVYPQPGGAMIVSSAGDWSRDAFFGTGTDRAGGEGETFVLDVVGASSDANSTLAEYLHEDYPAGLARLPSGTRILASIQVVRAGC